MIKFGLDASGTTFTTKKKDIKNSIFFLVLLEFKPAITDRTIDKTIDFIL